MPGPPRREKAGRAIPRQAEKMLRDKKNIAFPFNSGKIQTQIPPFLEYFEACLDNLYISSFPVQAAALEAAAIPRLNLRTGGSLKYFQCWAACAMPCFAPRA